MQITSVLKEFRWKLSFTFLLILLEAIVPIFFPLFIGFAIDSAISGSHTGSMYLGGLGVVALLLGGGRRFFDSRLYAKIYVTLCNQAIGSIKDKADSVKAARLGMIKELVEFMENALPELIANVIGLVGVVIIMATLNLNVFLFSLLATGCVFLIYRISRRKTIRLNKQYNDVLEDQVAAIASSDGTRLDENLKGLMKWNIKLSDLETLNFSMSWLLLMAFLVTSIILSVDAGVTQYGTLFSLVMYVFQYMESVISLPLYYQNWLRLTEITGRLKEF